MKKLLLTLVAIATMLCSCTKDNDSAIVGKWKAESYTDSYYKDGKLFSTESGYYDAVSLEYYFVFNANNTYNYFRIDKGESISTSGSYLIVGSKLTMGGTSYDIETLNNNTLVLKEEQYKGEYKLIEEITFKKTK